MREREREKGVGKGSDVGLASTKGEKEVDTGGSTGGVGTVVCWDWSREHGFGENTAVDLKV